MNRLHARLTALEAARHRQTDPMGRVVVYVLGQPLPPLPADGRPRILLPDNGRCDLVRQP